ncbi:hypothetical protein CASFOL_004248 [Castilleja foliolosa]|uniref:Uncharacterized protein n=1 Tax=Castilleja foliolosa TaxID=1961234 RepID=A0ABD3EA10_9LAMI
MRCLSDDELAASTWCTSEEGRRGTSAAEAKVQAPIQTGGVRVFFDRRLTATAKRHGLRLANVERAQMAGKLVVDLSNYPVTA